MPFILHNGVKKLYFPKSWSVDQARDNYINYIQVENILGGNYAKKSPHQYQTSNFQINVGDVVLDIGSAEALLSLDVIDIAKKIYIFESDEIWIEPLKATFEPYQDKVVIFNKFVSDKNSATEIRLDSCIEFDKVQSLFIKVDIEGSEKLVLENNKHLFEKNINIRVVCCTYHRQNDADIFKVFFESLGYTTEYSDGYMIFIYDNELRAPYFRHGIIRAEKLVNLLER